MVYDTFDAKPGPAAGCHFPAPALRPQVPVIFDFEICPALAAGLLREKTARFIDVRGPWEFATTRIEGSEPMQMGEVPARARQELDPDERLAMGCHYSIRSMNFAVWLGTGVSIRRSRRVAAMTLVGLDRSRGRPLLTQPILTPIHINSYSRLVPFYLEIILL